MKLDKELTLETLQTKYRSLILAEFRVGSHAYGLATPESDEDTKGIFALPSESYLRSEPPPEQVSDEKNDVCYYSLKRFCELASGANPNFIELLFMPDDCRLFVSPLFQSILDVREIFITKQAAASHLGYAQMQIKKAKGKNKRVNQPYSEIPPQKEDFCAFIPKNPTLGEMPLRPVPLRASGVNLEHCNCSAVEKIDNLYRLYEYGPEAGGVFHNNQIVCRSIPKQDESPRCIGLLIFQQIEFEKETRHFKEYWHWRKHRNEARWTLQETGQRNFDTKNMMHTLRLLMSAESIFTTGKPQVRFEGKMREYLMQVRHGEFEYGTLMEDVQRRVTRLEKIAAESSLPESVDTEKVDTLVLSITQQIEKEMQ